MNITEAAEFIGRTVKTLQRLDRQGKLIPSRSKTNRRVYTKEQLLNFQGQNKEIRLPYRNIVYCRVSSFSQKPDLENQSKILQEYCSANGLDNIEIIKEIGGGLNFKRKKFLVIMDSIMNKEVKKLIIAHKDRLCRFGFDWFERFCIINNCKLIVLNQERLSPEQEMVQDLMTIIHCFSSRLYGLRNYRKSLKAALNASDKKT